MKTATRLDVVKPSATLAISAKATELKLQGKDIITLSTGEPDFATPDHIKQAAISAIEHDQSYYTPVDGNKSLKQAIQKKFRNKNGLDYSLDQIIVSTGAKQTIFNACLALLNPGDEVIIPAPYWVSYPSIVEICEATPVCIATSQKNEFKLSAEQLSSAITSKTKMIILNSPSNPTGMLYDANNWRALAEILLQHPEILILSDDIYEHIRWYGNEYSNIVNVEPSLRERTIIVNGVSKAYAMTGWRIGYAAGPANIIKAMKKIQSQSTSNPCSIAQAAAEAALSGSQDSMEIMIAKYYSRQQTALTLVNDIAGFHCLSTEGAFYLFPNVEQAIAKLGVKNDVEFAGYILEHAEVAVVPGTAFGCPGHIRLSYATSEALFAEALQRIKRLFS